MLPARFTVGRAGLAGLLVAAAASACSVRGLPEKAQVCRDPRPEVCTAIYAPVCAFRLAEGLPPATYASGCSACADPMVAGFVEGACAE